LGRFLSLAIVINVQVAMVGTVFAAENEHWSYSGETGPDNWAQLSPDFAACGNGSSQSPIDIVGATAADLDTLELDFGARATSIVNNGHTLQVDVASGSWLHEGDDEYQLIQFHFHSPSEHQIAGELFPLEAHFVHRNEQGDLAVIGVVFRAGEWNDDLAKLGAVAPTVIDQPVPLNKDLSDFELYTNHESYYRYSGSLTTPPCTEGVRWFVLKAVGHIAPEQAATFVELIGNDARGPQPLNARIILEK